MKIRKFPCKCKICEKTFFNKDGLKRHNKRFHIPSKPVNCPHCNKVLKSSDYVKTHVRKFCQKSGKIRLLVSCPKCQKVMTQGSLETHLKNHEEQKRVCELCWRVLASKKTYDQHMRNVHSGFQKQSFPCATCGKNLPSKYSWKVHQEVHSVSTIKTPCHLCGQNVLLRTYNGHIRKCFGRNDFRCYFCQKPFGSFQILETHLTNFHTKEKPFTCNKCPYKTAIRSSLHSHKKHRHNERKYLYPCYFCGQTLLEKGSLKNHLSVKHLKEKPYKCGYCPKTFTSSSGLIFHMGKAGLTKDERGFQVGQHPCKITRQTCPHCGNEMFHKLLDRHIRTKHGPPRFTCYFCKNGYEFTTSGGLTGHLLNIHLKEKPFKCPHCPYRTCYVGNVPKHVEIHLGADRKKYSCYFCGKLFYCRNYYNTHTNSHLLEKGLQCDGCGKRFTSNWALERHYCSQCCAN